MILNCTSKPKKIDRIKISQDDDLCFDSRISSYDILSKHYMDSIPNSINMELWSLNAIPLYSTKNILFIDESDNQITGKYLYKDIEGFRKELESNNSIIPKGFIAIGYNDFVNNSNVNEVREYSEKLKQIYKKYNFKNDYDFLFARDTLKGLPEPISLKINYKFLTVFLHEAGHAFQHFHNEEKFLWFNKNENLNKRFILELNADYITGIFFAQIIYKQLFGNYIKKNKALGYPINIIVDFKGVDKKYNFNVSIRQSRSKKMKMFKQIGEAIFIEMLNHGDFLVGQKKHHGTNADRATAFYNGYIDALQEPFDGIKSSQLVKEEIEHRLNNYNRLSEPWN